MIEVKITPAGVEIHDLRNESVVNLESAHELDELIRCLMQKRNARFMEDPMPADLVHFRPFMDYGDRMRIVEFMKGVASNFLTDDDGHGYWATEEGVSNHRITPSSALEGEAPAWATHVQWYNR